MSKIMLIHQLMKKIKLGKELMAEFPDNRAEYLDETLRYSKILYDIMKESMLP